ncbi:hypothetical protein Bca4012_100110 [Brassica carinata]|uniref:Uncharacterized protein n=2 Tax=Brassica TaxID=3705 RepID=A0A8S9PNX3_BRACR|nr:hypothetical protein F2Q69_00049747 [Brassica cretica]KAG2252544.1 hypothetical protein Bca52824_082680 [Brassica carinata]
MKRRMTPCRALKRGFAAEMCWSVEDLVWLQRCVVPSEISSHLFWASYANGAHKARAINLCRVVSHH